MRQHRRHLWLGSIILSTLMLSACGDEVTPSQSGTDSSPEEIVTPGPTQTSLPSGPYEIPDGAAVYHEITSEIEDALTPQFLAGATDFIVVGTVREHLEPRWATADGSKPETTLSDPTFTIYTPVVIDLEAPPLFNKYDNGEEITQVVLLIEGGTIDNVEVHHTGSYYDLPVSARILVGAIPVPGDRALSIPPDVASQLMPEGFNQLWLSSMRFIAQDGMVSANGYSYEETSFFEELNAAIEQRNAE